MIDTLNKKEINRLILLGIKLQLALSCDINHTGLPCRTDRLKAVEYMIEYLKIHNEEINDITDGEKKEIPQEDWVKGYNKWRKTK